MPKALYPILLATVALIPCAAQTPPLTVRINNPNLPTVIVAGDSTANNTDHKGWGDPFADYFDSTKINVLNRARAGRSARTFLTEGLWDKVVAEMKAGDYVLIQFGHNDGSAPDQPPYRGDLPGIGSESKEITGKDGKTETIYTFGWYIRKFIADTRAKNAHPVVLSLTVRNIWQDGKVERGSGQFSKWLQDVAEAEKVPFVDLTNIIADVYEKMGQDKVKELFPADHTHTSQVGADLNASLVVAGLKGIRSPVVKYLSAKGEAVAAAPSLAILHLPVPANPTLPTLLLIGDSTVRNGRASLQPLRCHPDQCCEPRRRRTQQPHFLYRTLLGKSAGDDQARRFCGDAIRPQRRRFAGRSNRLSFESARRRRRSEAVGFRNRAYIWVVPEAVHRRGARQRSNANCLFACAA